MCDVQGMSVTTAETETDYEDCNNYAHAHVFTKCFKPLHTLLGFVFVLRVDLVLRVVNWCSCRRDRPLNLYPKFLHVSHRENWVF